MILNQNEICSFLLINSLYTNIIFLKKILDPELNKIDERLLSILALQRLQQLLPRKKSHSFPSYDKNELSTDGK